MNKLISIGCSVALIFFMTGCSKKSDTTEQTTPVPQASAPAQTASIPAPAAAIKTGTVAETMDAGGYTYMLVDDGTSQVWVAITQAPVKVGEEVSYFDGMVMQNFESKSLGRTFESVVFSSGLASGSAGAGEDSFSAALSSEGSAPAALGSSKAIVEKAEVAVEKATGDNSYTIDEIFSKAAELDGQNIRVQAKVMKVSRNIMGMTWVHLQDGTGDPAQNTHDLVVTTTDEVADGLDVVLVSGKLAANKDFGAGYKYAAIVEEATITDTSK
jgi:hypothetical protein